jgi:hypothetical protein
MLAPQALKIRSTSRPSRQTRAKLNGFAESRAAVSTAISCRWARPSVGDSGATRGAATRSQSPNHASPPHSAGPPARTPDHVLVVDDSIGQDAEVRGRRWPGGDIWLVTSVEPDIGHV